MQHVAPQVQEVEVADEAKVKHEVAVRTALAACFRFFAREGMNEGVANHLSYQLDCMEEDGKDTMLVNGFGFHFANVTAGSLVKADLNDDSMKECDWSKPPQVEPTAICIHGEIHRLLGKRARCVMHLHPHYITALACLQHLDHSVPIPPLDQNTMRFYKRLSYDPDMDGMGLGDEARRMATCIGPKNSAILLGHHGALVISETIGGALDEMYYLEKAARTYVTALSTGLPLKVVSPEVAEKTAQQWEVAEEVYGEAFLQQVVELCSGPELRCKL